MSVESSRHFVVGCTVGCTTVLAACNGTTSYMDPIGMTGRAEGILGWWLTAVACVVVLLICVAILLGIARHRGEHNVPPTYADEARQTRGAGRDATGTGRHPSEEKTARREISSGLNWIYIGTAATIVVLIATFAGTMVTLGQTSRPPRPASLTMDVIGHQWWWEIRYSDPTRPDLGFTTANEVHLPVGQPVRVRVQTADVIHSFWLPQLAGKMDLIPGQINETWLEAERPGLSRGTCGEYCGLQHATMAIAVTAESPERFAQWAQARRTPPPPPTTADARAGKVVFARSCGACHAVQGTNALGRLGPDLTHLWSRPTIGAGALQNTPANLARWIHDAPAVKEGSRMPAIPLDSAELRSVVAYLQTLY